jgi:pimeloyl-ACP methyl ester carboxylesterase
MPYATTDDGVKLYYEETGSGVPLVFVHEFAGDYRSWEPQVRSFGRRYRCVAFNARGYPPSEVPADVARYSQARARDDIRAVLDHLGIDRAHVVGLSMGGFATLHFGLAYPDRARSLVVAGCGYGAEPERRERYPEESQATAQLFETQGSRQAALTYASGPWRIPFLNKDPRGWEEFRDRLAEHDATGSALTMRGVQMHRPSLWDLTEDLKRLEVPTLIMTGDEDEPCLNPALFMKRMIPAAGLVVLPTSGHTLNLEEPDLFNRAVQDFLATVDAGRWRLREPCCLPSSLMIPPRTPTSSPPKRRSERSGSGCTSAGAPITSPATAGIPSSPSADSSATHASLSPSAGKSATLPSRPA